MRGKNFRNFDFVDCKIFAFEVKKTHFLTPSLAKSFGFKSS